LVISPQRDALDVTNFDPDFLNEPAQDSFVDSAPLSETAQGQFTGFSYNRPYGAALGEAGQSLRDPSFPASISE
jgi:hypothetical protein